jgi:Bacterial PH domain
VGLIGGSREDAPRPASRREHSVWTRLLAPGEQVQELHRLPRTTLLFTGRRLILVEEAMTGRRVDYVSIPYRSITHFAVEASGVFAAEADLRIWVVGRAAPLEKSFGADVDVYAVQALLAQHLAA